MATTQTWTEYNGAAGVTVTPNATDCNWKNIDNCTVNGSGTVYTANPITAGSNSFSKFQSLVYAGTANALSLLSYTISLNAGTGWQVNAAVIGTATTPATTTTAVGTTLMPTSGTSLAGTFGTNATGQSVVGGSAVAGIAGTPSMYATCLATQLTTTGGASPGNINSGAALTITATWTES